MGQCLAILAAVARTTHGRNLAPGEGHNVFVEGEVAVTRGRYGVSVTDLGDRVVGTHLREIGEWEQPIVDIAAELLRPGDTVWECGGHVGAHTLGLAAAVGASGLVHVWEPQRAPRLPRTAVQRRGCLRRRPIPHLRPRQRPCWRRRQRQRQRLTTIRSRTFPIQGGRSK